MAFSGDGLAMRVIPDDQTTSFTVENREQAFEMPAQLLIGPGMIFFSKETHAWPLLVTLPLTHFLRISLQVALSLV